ncbi:MAG: hypothetical protein K940chlam7_00111 [Chlamydiae bacterium]|nr:hypothetical protein [Chlamydiota bacterium]
MFVPSTAEMGGAAIQAFDRPKEEVKDRPIQKVYKGTRELAGDIESQIGRPQQSKKCCLCCRKIKKVTAIKIIVAILGSALIGWGSISNIEFALRSNENTAYYITVFAATILGTVLLNVVQLAIGEIDDDQYRDEVLEGFKQNQEGIKQNQLEAEKFNRLIESFGRFLANKGEETDPQKQKELMTDCIQRFDATPQSYRAKIAPKERWISLLLQMLPENHPLRERVRDLHDVATLRHKLKPTKGPSELGSMFSLPLPTPEHVREEKGLLGSESEDPISSDSDSETEDPISSDSDSETEDPIPRVPTLPSKIREGDLDSEDDSILISSSSESEGQGSRRKDFGSDFSISSSEGELQSSSTLRKVVKTLRRERNLSPEALEAAYQTYWRELEKELQTTDIHGLEFGGTWIGEGGETAKTVEELQQRTLKRKKGSKREENELEIVIE